MRPLKLPASTLIYVYSRIFPKHSFNVNAQTVLHFLIPSVFVANPAKPPSRPLDPRIAAQRASTDCLDGLRGVAAFAVMIFHYTQYAYPRLRQVYGFEGRQYIIQLPFIKIWYSGGFMVFLFFVISGYVLSARIVRLMEQERRDNIMKVLSSMTFRRVVRLGIPSLVASFISFSCARLGFLGKPTKEFEPSFLNDTIFYLQSLRNLFTFYDWKQYHIWHLEPLWTIAVEFRCSMILFLVLCGIARVRRSMRLIIESLILIDTILHDRWDLGCFILGLIVAELHVHSQEEGYRLEEKQGLLTNTEIDDSNYYPSSTPQDRSAFSPTLVKGCLWTAFVVGMYLGSVPTEGTCQTPGYSALCSLTWHSEPWRYIALPGSFLIVLAILFLPILQRPLASPTARYLGRVSYALYLVHELVNKLMGKEIRRLAWSILGTEGVMYHIGYAVGLAFFVLLCLWLADMFMRAVDIPATDLARWLEEQWTVK